MPHILKMFITDSFNRRLATALLGLLFIVPTGRVDAQSVAQLQTQLAQAKAAKTAADAKLTQVENERRNNKAEIDRLKAQVQQLNASMDKELKAVETANKEMQATHDPAKGDELLKEIHEAEARFNKARTEQSALQQKIEGLDDYKKYSAARNEANTAAGKVSALEKKLASAQAAAQKTPAVPKPSATPEQQAASSPATKTPGSGPTASDDTVIVPDLSPFDNVSEMKAVLAHAGLVGVFKGKSNHVSKEVEFKFAPPSNPPANAKVGRGSPVIVFIYQKFEGSAQATPAGTPDTSFFTAILPDLKTGPGEVPNLIGLTLDQAVSRLPSNMRIGSDQVGEMPPTPEQAYTIWAQKPGPGPEKGQQINISVKRYGSAKKAEPEPEYTPPGTSGGTVSDDLIGEWEGAMAMPGGKRKDNLNVSISKQGGEYAVSVMNATQKARVEGGKLVCNQNAWGGAMNFRWSFTGSGDTLNTELFVTSPASKETQTLRATLHRRR
jgi:hypothetical protein